MNRINYSTGEFAGQYIKIIKQKGCYWNTIGFYHEGHISLYPEEALYLINQNNLLLLEGNNPLSVEASHLILQKLLPPSHLNVYSNLKSAGFVVRRHQQIRGKKNEKTGDKTNLSVTSKAKNVKDLSYDLESEIYFSYKNQSIDSIPNKYQTFEDLKENLPNLHNGKDILTLDKTNIPYIPIIINNPNNIIFHSTLPAISSLNISNKHHKCDYEDGILSFNRYKYMINKLQIASNELINWQSYKKVYFDLYNKMSINYRSDAQMNNSNFEFNFKDNPIKTLEDMLEIHYDIYKPNKKFSKSNPGIPDFFVHIVDCDPYTQIPDEMWVGISQFVKSHAKLGMLLIAYCDEEEPQYISINDMIK